MPASQWIGLALLGLGYVYSLIHGNLGLLALPTLIALLCTGLLVNRAARWQQIIGHALFVLLALGLALHWLPGFQGSKVIDKALWSEGAVPFTMYLNLDKPLIGFWLLLACPWVLAMGGKRLLPSLAATLPAVIAACLGGAWLVGIITWTPKWPEQAWLWMLNNLLLVSLTEELLFRGYIQGGLQRLLKNQHLALFFAAGLFALAHLGAGWLWVVLAFVAGIGYGLAYRYGGLFAAILCHFGLNLAHFAGFTYPMLAPS
ncbi:MULTISPECIES: CPBP family intramembrane glutamic endopeptidase [Pseudomonas]|uniref:Type II CAAX endopeptidase family protein n=1 Tax=Pseudomonas auratipiscis TaxID=3115853 RepID=A0AB35X3V9_9PSED|nr:MULTISPECIES: type II CAAX endopeptidase family protein [unclassified Pseudomonas]MEE1868954.1 type II CAAX endopeptidase family protein [Pseudomonas sp. 120P]MEE1959601.1 type II CAAX endopeptidase family protein [Pseudomonas sp. 119P]